MDNNYSIQGFKDIGGVEIPTFYVRTDNFDHVISLVIDLVTVPNLTRIQIHDVTNELAPARYGEWTLNRDYRSKYNRLTTLGGYKLPHNS